MKPRTEMAHRRMQRRSAPGLRLLLRQSCWRAVETGHPTLLESAGYHVRDGNVHYLNAFPAKAFEIDSADPNTFRVLNADFECAADAQRAFYRQAVIAEADPRAFPPDRAVANCTETSISFAE